MIFTVTKEHDGMTVLQILKNTVCLSGAMIKHIKFLDDGIVLNGERVTVRRIVREGDILELNTSDNIVTSDISPCNLPLDIVYEDSELVIPDKPAFMPTHPSHGHYDDTVANALAYRYKDMGDPYIFRPVNRLDRNTSGLLIVARNRISAGRLAKSMAEKKINKKYIAVLDGVLTDDEGVIDTYMRRTAESIIVREVCGKEEGADHALTRYKVLFRSEKNCVVLAEPITGRTHQLRVHFASLGCSITGDDLYGKECEYISRHALHATEISFPHPSNNELMRFSAPIHSDMRYLIKNLFPNKDIPNEF